MSPHCAELIVHQVVPRLKSLVPISVRPVGHEDPHELIQDGSLMAARMLLSAEAKGKKVTAGNVTHYTVLHLRSGRRSYSAGCSDVLHPKSRILRGEPESFEFHVKEDECGGEPLMLADVFSNDSEDPSTAAARKLDWELFWKGLNERCRAVLTMLAEGAPMRHVAARFKVSITTIRAVKDQLAALVREFFGDSILAEIARQPQWKHNLMAQRELVACREQRLHS
jgi:hypothetical protein